MLPVYAVLKIQRDKHVCKQNLGHIFKAITMYAADNNDRFPPVFVEGEGGEPQLFSDKGSPEGPDRKNVVSWMTLVQPHLNSRASFECPAADESEHVHNLNSDPEKAPFASDYGMYKAWSAYNMLMVSNPDRSVLIGEGTNHAANDTFDPSPYSGGQDGFVFGWNDSNDKPGPNSESITRLAFPDTKSGKFSKDGRTRHGDSSLFISVSGQLLSLKPDAARIQYMDASKSEIVGRWATR
jgi:hypothetical protein